MKFSTFFQSKFVWLFFSLFFIVSCQKEQLSETDKVLNNLLIEASNGVGTSFFVFPDAADLSKIPQDLKNPLTKEKVDLGRLLYHETGLAVNPMQDMGKQQYSCASCHFASAGFQAGRFQGIGEGGFGFGINGEGRTRTALYPEENLDVQPIRTPTTLNTAYQENMLWNGQFGATAANVGTEAQWTEDTPKAINHLGYEGLESQAIAGLKVHRLDIEMDFLETTNYRSLFDAVFGDRPMEERYTLETTGLAIAAYERTLLAAQAPFQEWLKGNTQALSEQEKKGAILFFGKADCGTCHTGPALNSMAFYNLGMKDLVDYPEETFKTDASLGSDKGRGGFTGKMEDLYKFKVPQLYNLTDSPFYGHGSSFRSLQEVVEYKNEAIAQQTNQPNGQLAVEFTPLDLSEEEILDITAFLETALYDPTLKRYEPESLPSGFCFPNNDAMSRMDLGCD